MTVSGDLPESAATPPAHRGGDSIRRLRSRHRSVARRIPSCCRGAARCARSFTALASSEQAIGTFLIVVILVLVLVQVAQRYIPGGWPWTGEVARLALVWCTFMPVRLPDGIRPSHRRSS